MFKTLQVDELARITGLTQAQYKTHLQPLNGVPQCLVWHVGGEIRYLVGKDRE